MNNHFLVVPIASIEALVGFARQVICFNCKIVAIGSYLNLNRTQVAMKLILSCLLLVATGLVVNAKLWTDCSKLFTVMPKILFDNYVRKFSLFYSTMQVQLMIRPGLRSNPSLWLQKRQRREKISPSCQLSPSVSQAQIILQSRKIFTGSQSMHN